ncbi:peptide chain release factor N(5)-glutamine methyltransferase [Roseibium salinum]|uniref:Release factor glutamine methyltransferase n=1 Tax=Roseibium salinum TaxID=1604349 RepID=A0ABT3R7D8_9HYPH|nr:peptide chain release factor N(5)-glutamine methyltransferase [Roseibium sp. DSM 29163]MCX2725217.1 peptide chain release factor N(5)-glutamine methyltransferase [Roseibium sp. DSM 29163]
MLIGELYRQVRGRFRNAGLSTPELDARVLVSAALKIPAGDLILRETDSVSDEKASLAAIYAEQRLKGMPVGRILGEREFYGRRFLLNDATLEPRPDTEVLIDAILQRVGPDQPGIMCDIGTGTGAIAVTLLAELPQSRMIAVDLSEHALHCAVQNARLQGVEERFHPVCADYCSALRPGLDWIVSNPPYIRSSVLGGLAREVILHDPVLALDGGETGLAAYVQIATEAEILLKPGGGIALEIGYDQAADVDKQLRHHGFGAIEIIKDLAGNDRVVTARKI